MRLQVWAAQWNLDAESVEKAALEVAEEMWNADECRDDYDPWDINLLVLGEDGTPLQVNVRRVGEEFRVEEFWSIGPPRAWGKEKKS